VLFVASEKRSRAQYPAGGKSRNISGKTSRDVELKLRDALAKRNTVGEFQLFWVSAKTPGRQFKALDRVKLGINKFIIQEIWSVKL